MKRLNYLLTSLLVLFWAFPGTAAAQSTGGLGGPLGEVVDTAADPGKVLEDVVDEVKKPVDKVVDEVEKPVDKAVDSLPGPVKKPVEEATKEVDKAVRNVTGAAKDSAEGPGSVVKNPGQTPAPSKTETAGHSKSARSDSATSATRTRVAAAKSTGAMRGTSRAGSARDTEEVAAAGSAIEPAQVKGVQIVAPATQAEESEGSGLSHTGAQILKWLVLACLLVGVGMALARGGRARIRVARA